MAEAVGLEATSCGKRRRPEQKCPARGTCGRPLSEILRCRAMAQGWSMQMPLLNSFRSRIRGDCGSAGLRRRNRWSWFLQTTESVLDAREQARPGRAAGWPAARVLADGYSHWMKCWPAPQIEWQLQK